jgi:hypothetical protein
MANIGETLRVRLEELKTLRDEIRVDLKLASMELRDEWHALEKRLPDTARLAAEIKEATVEKLDEVVADLRRFRDRLSKRD